MRRICVLVSLLLVGMVGLVPGQHSPHKNMRKAVALEGLGNLHHPVSTKNAEAQKFFDQGLRLIYAFNHDEALLAFQRAAELDPNLGMAYWGMALSVGPNYNMDAEAEKLKQAYEAIRRAGELAASAPAEERAYIAALAKRYSADPKSDKKKNAQAYATAMRDLHRDYPDDLDAATLFAESLMNLRPWELWTSEGKPAPETPEILTVLEGVLRRNPDHTGANHYYIHAIEASPYPERGLPAADRLARLALGAGHLVHMPAHIYARVGDHAAAARANQDAAAVDRAYLDRFQVRGIYPMMYYSHNLHFLAVARGMQGRFEDAKKAADQLAAHVGPHVADMPMLEGFVPTPTLILVRFQRWKEILDLPTANPKQPMASCVAHFARGSALASLGKIEDAEKELASLERILKELPTEQGVGERNKARDVLGIPAAVLQARIAQAQKQDASAIAWLQKAVTAEDALAYIEPADWHIPTRELLGAVQVRAQRLADAEKTFRADLVRNPRNPRSLFGLMETLRLQQKTQAARLVEQEFQAAWKNADQKTLALEQF